MDLGPATVLFGPSPGFKEDSTGRFSRGMELKSLRPDATRALYPPGLPLGFLRAGRVTDAERVPIYSGARPLRIEQNP